MAHIPVSDKVTDLAHRVVVATFLEQAVGDLLKKDIRGVEHVLTQAYQIYPIIFEGVRSAIVEELEQAEREEWDAIEREAEQLAEREARQEARKRGELEGGMPWTH